MCRVFSIPFIFDEAPITKRKSGFHSFYDAIKLEFLIYIVQIAYTILY